MERKRLSQMTPAEIAKRLGFLNNREEEPFVAPPTPTFDVTTLIVTPHREREVPITDGLVIAASLRSTLERLAPDYPAAAALLDPTVTHVGAANYLAFRPKDGTLSFLPNGRPLGLVPKKDDPEDTRWAREGRQDGRIGKVIRAVLDNEAYVKFGVTDHQIERLSYRLRGMEVGLGRIVTVVRGADVVKYYSRAHSGGGNSSCMTGFRHLPLVERYPDKCGLLIVKDEARDVAFGRALLWTTEHGLVVDRIYADAVDREAMIQHAMDEKWIARNWSTYDWCRTAPGSGKIESGTFYTRVVLGGPVPNLGHYLDTFGHYRTREEGYLYNNSAMRSDGFHKDERPRY